MTDATIANGLKLTDDPEARRLVREAHARMYKWPKEFGGYRADVTLNHNGTIVRRVSFGENGGVGTRMILLSNHEVME